jgi:hypothetical protein
MSKDLKIGMIIGVVLLIAATLVISFLPGGSLRGRLKGKFKKETTTPYTSDSNDVEQTPSSENSDQNEQVTGKIHIVTEGETIHDIAEKYFRNRRMIIKIVDENPLIPDDYKLKAGMTLKIPE